MIDLDEYHRLKQRVAAQEAALRMVSETQLETAQQIGKILDLLQVDASLINRLQLHIIKLQEAAAQRGAEKEGPG